MRATLKALLILLLLLGGAAAYVWYEAPHYLPAEWRQQNPQSKDYQPTLYRWKDEQGRTQITDTPPQGRPYETVSVDPDTNVVPPLAPTGEDD